MLINTVNFLFIFLWATFMACGALASEKNDTEQVLFKKHSNHLVWEAITRIHDQSKGAKFHQQHSLGQEIKIQADGSAIFQIPKDNWLKLVTSSDHQDQAPSLWYSPGNGLFVPVAMHPLANKDHLQPHTWVLPPPLKHELTFMLKNTNKQTDSWWLSRANNIVFKESDLYREFAHSKQNNSSWLYQTNQGKHLQLTQLKENQSYSIELQGPGEWQLESRVLLNSSQSWQRFIDLKLLLNDKIWRNWRLHPSRDDSDTLENQSCQQLTSHPELITLALPKGLHQLSFSAPSPMAVRLFKKEEDPFLFQPSTLDFQATFKQTHLNRIKPPWAQPAYDESLLTEYFSGQLMPKISPISTSLPPNLLHKREKSIQLILQRYHAWQALSVTGENLNQQSVWLIDTKEKGGNKNRNHFVQKQSNVTRKKQTLLQFQPNKALKVHAPSSAKEHTIKLSIPVYEKAFDIDLADNTGLVTQWLWRPDLVNQNNLVPSSSEDLSVLASQNAIRAIASVSGITTLNKNSFPITITHNAQQALWLSPFYRNSLPFTLSQKGWLEALQQLGADKMLELLMQVDPFDSNHQDQKPLQKKQNQLARLKEQVWQDWQPLRHWLLNQQQKWENNLTTSKFGVAPLRHEPLKEFIKRLNDQQQERLLRKVLKGMAVRDSDPIKRQQALDWLYEHYSKQQDIGNLSSYHSWQFQQNPQEHLGNLADWLVSQGQSKLAIKLFKLKDTSNHHLPYQVAKWQQNWQDYSKTPSILSKLWASIWQQNWAQAVQLSQKLPEENKWRTFLASIPAANLGDDWLEKIKQATFGEKSTLPNQVAWLQWIKEYNTNTKSIIDLERAIDFSESQVPISLVAHHSQGNAQLYQSQNNSHFQQALIKVKNPVQYSVIGPINMQLSIRLQHDTGIPNQSLDDWIEIENNGNKKWFPIVNSQASKNLTLITEKNKAPGSLRKINLTLGPGLHQLNISPLTHTALVSAKVFSPALFRNLVKAIQDQSQIISNQLIKPTDSILKAQALLNNINITYINECSELSDKSHSLTLFQSFKKIKVATQWQAEHTLNKSPTSIKEWSPSDVSTNQASNSQHHIEQQLLSILWHWPLASENQKLGWLAKANSLAYPFTNDSFISNLLNSINQHFTWQPEQIVISSAGKRRSQAYEKSPKLVEYEKLLWKNKKPQGLRLSPHSKTGFVTRFKRKSTVRIGLSQKTFPYYQAPPTNIVVSLNGRVIQRLTGSPKKQSVKFSIPSGQQKVAIYLDKPSKDLWVYVQADAYLKGQWQALIKENPKSYEVATHQNPLALHIDQPRWIRIEELTKGKISHTFRFIDQDNPFIIKPSGSKLQSMVRVLSLQPKTSTKILHPYSFPLISKAIYPAPFKPLIVNNLKTQELLVSDMPYMSDHTNGIYFQYQSRQDFDSDKTQTQSERFFQGGWRHRKKLLCQSCYWRSDLFSRHHENNDIQLLGTHQRLQGAWAQSSWSWQLNQSLYIQNNQNTHYKWFGAATLKQSHSINKKMKHGHQIQIFSRHFSQKSINFITDNDIYSDYQQQHLWGIRLQETLSARPWLDTLWRSHLRLMSNELENSTKAEYVQAGINWHQFFKPLELNVYYRHRHYLKDENRNQSVDKPVLGLNLRIWQNVTQGRVIQWQARIDSALDNNKFNFNLEMSWDFSQGRGLRDFSPSESAFFRLQKTNTQASHHTSEDD